MVAYYDHYREHEPARSTKNVASSLTHALAVKVNPCYSQPLTDSKCQVNEFAMEAGFGLVDVAVPVVVYRRLEFFESICISSLQLSAVILFLSFLFLLSIFYLPGAGCGRLWGSVGRLAAEKVLQATLHGLAAFPSYVTQGGRSRKVGVWVQTKTGCIHSADQQALAALTNTHSSADQHM